MPELAEWDSFYVIVGSAAGALIGLQFVVMTLIAVRPPSQGGTAGAAYGTPTIVHFSTALLMCALLRAPWHSMAPLALLVMLIGLGGFIYMSLVTWRIRRQTIYKADWEDWTFHVVLPFAAYLALALAALTVFTHAREALFGVGAATLLMLFVGIHNAWDAVAYHVFVNLAVRKADEATEPPKSS